MKSFFTARVSKKIYIIWTIVLIVSVLVFYCWSKRLPDERLAVNFMLKNQRPNWDEPFGTDWLGRNMFARVVKGLGISLKIGLLSAFFSTLIAWLLSACALHHRYWDKTITYLINLTISIPHILLLIIISFVAGGKTNGVIIALSLTHWPSLTRLFKSEMLQIQQLEYVQVSRKLGKSRGWVTRNHFLPLMLPQVFLSFVLTVPHVLLHESALTFLGFGLSSNVPAIGNILSQSMTYLLNGSWWLALFPGVSLLLSVMIINQIGQQVKTIFQIS